MSTLFAMSCSGSRITVSCTPPARPACRHRLRLQGARCRDSSPPSPAWDCEVEDPHDHERGEGWSREAERLARAAETGRLDSGADRRSLSWCRCPGSSGGSPGRRHAESDSAREEPARLEGWERIASEPAEGLLVVRSRRPPRSSRCCGAWGPEVRPQVAASLAVPCLGSAAVLRVGGDSLRDLRRTRPRSHERPPSPPRCRLPAWRPRSLGACGELLPEPELPGLPFSRRRREPGVRARGLLRAGAAPSPAGRERRCDGPRASACPARWRGPARDDEPCSSLHRSPPLP